MTDETPVVPFAREVDARPEAAEWLARLDRGNLTAEERASFEAWLAEDPKHKVAIRRIAGFWYGLDAPLGLLCDPARAMPERPGRSATAFSSGGGRPIPLTKMAAAIAAVAVLALLLFVSLQPRGAEDETGYFATDIGRSRQITLSDGSNITLNTNSILEQDYSREERTVRLMSGEAVFEVAHDTDRPFVVHAADGVIRAVGTRFAVRVGADAVSVTVTEGRIALQQRRPEWEMTRNGAEAGAPGPDSGAPPLAAPIIVSQGEVGRIDRTEGASKRAVSEREVNERLSWVDGELVFYDRELESVIEEIARYTPAVIRIQDEKLKARRITGIIQIGDLDMMLDSIEQNLGVRVERVSPNLIYLRS